MSANTLSLRENWEPKLAALGLGVGRIVIGLLWFSQLLWKLPPTFGCPADFHFTTKSVGSSGLCDWIGREAAYAGTLRVFNLDLHLLGLQNFYIDLSPLSAAYGAFLNGFALPNFSWFAYVIFAMELFITVTILFGVLSRLGALVGTLQAANLTIGLLPVPGEWEWIYIMLTAFNFALFATAAGRYYGIDGWLHPRAVEQAKKGNRFAKIVALMT